MTPPAAASSPVTFPMSGHFSEEDIHELLGAMGDTHHPAEQQFAALPETADVRHQPHPGDVHALKHEELITTEQQQEPEEAISAKALAEARSERKRSREKQRRSDVNKQFADLTQLLKRIEAQDLDGSIIQGSMPSGSSPTNRVDLIARTIAVLERMHDMSCKRRREVVDLNRQLEEMKKMAEDTAARLKEATLYQQGPPKPVMMMVPMMLNPGAAAVPQVGAAAGAAAPTVGAPGFAMASPFMQQAVQPHMFMPQVAAAAPTAATTSATNMTTQVPQQQQATAQMPQQPVMFPQVMFGSTTPSPSPPASSGSSTQPSSPQQQGQKQPANINGGGNLAHCA